MLTLSSSRRGYLRPLGVGALVIACLTEFYWIATSVIRVPQADADLPTWMVRLSKPRSVYSVFDMYPFSCMINFSDIVICFSLCSRSSSTNYLQSRFRSLFYLTSCHRPSRSRPNKNNNILQQRFVPSSTCFQLFIWRNIQRLPSCEHRNFANVQSNGGMKKKRRADGCWKMKG